MESIQAILLKMTELLLIGGLADWAGALQKCQNEIVADPSATTGKILSLYGGMGSLNDLILYSNGTLLKNENNELDSLRSQLYDSCRRLKNLK